MTITPVKDSSGEVTHFIAIKQDITGRKQTEEKLRENQAYFQRLIENSTDVITVFDPSGRMEYVSPTVERVLGYKPNELAGHSALDFIHPDDMEATVAALAQAAENPGTTTSVLVRFRHRAPSRCHGQPSSGCGSSAHHRQCARCHRALRSRAAIASDAETRIHRATGRRGGT